MRALRQLTLGVTLLALAAVGPSAAAFPKWNELEDYTFAAWAREAGRRYRGAEEQAMREAVFTARLAAIRKHNADPSQTYKMGVNRFSDWTAEEYKQYNTARPAAQPQTVSSSAPTQFYSSTNNGYRFWFHADVYETNGVPVPHSVDYRTASPSVLTGIKDQGGCGSCWAFSVTESMETHFAIQFGRLPVLSPEQLSACSLANNGCGGGDTFFGFQYVQLVNGQYEEWVYPYTDYFKNSTAADTSACRNITAEWRSSFVQKPIANVKTIWVVEQNDATATMEALAFRGPLTVSVSAAGWDNYESGVFQNPSTDAYNLDHAVQLVGYGHDDSLNVNYWIVRNSWGTSWGEAGFIRLLRPEEEPCGSPSYGSQTYCGTSGVLAFPAFPETLVVS